MADLESATSRKGKTRDTRVGKLNAARVAQILRGPPCSPINDGGGLYLDHPRPNAGYWFYRWVRNGKDTRLDIGPVHTFTLAEARERARKFRQMRHDGIDPKETRVKAKPTTTVAAAYPDFHAVRIAHLGGKQRQQYELAWQRDIEPVLGGMDPAAISTDDVIRVLRGRWQTHPVLASRMRGLIENFLDHLKVRGLRSGENPARWKGHLEHLLPRGRPAVRHLAALPWRRAPEFMEKLRGTPGTAARAIELIILLGARVSEIRLAKWGWIDWQARVITVPAEFTKGDTHRKPLPLRAIEILREMGEREGDSLIFHCQGKPPASSSLLRVVQTIEPNITAHGCRSCLRDWSAEATNFPREVCELTLGHSIKGAVERAYWRGDALEQRRMLIEQWSKFCSGPSLSGNNVVNLQAAAGA